MKRFIFIALAVLLLLACLFFYDAFVLMLLSVMQAYIMLPIVKMLERRNNGKVSVLITFAVFLLAITLLIVVLLPIVLSQLRRFVVDFPQYIENTEATFNSLLEFLKRLGIDNVTINQKIISYLSQLKFDFGKVFSFAEILLFVPIITYYLILDRKKIIKGISFLFPQKSQNRVMLTCKKINSQVEKYVFGQTVITVIVSVITIILLYAFNIEYAVLLGVVFGFLNLLPYFGPIIGTVIIAISGSGMGIKGIVTGIVISVAVQQIDNLFIHPFVMGKIVQVHPIEVLLSVLIFGKAFGIIGILISVPIYLAIKTVFNDVYYYFSEENQKNRNIVL